MDRIKISIYFGFIGFYDVEVCVTKVMLCRVVKVTVFMLLAAENLKSWQLRFIKFVA